LGLNLQRSDDRVELVWSQELANSSAARKREVELKGWSREKKLRLVAGLEKGEGKTQGKWSG
jgi:predicted GIY-YIG superfamily endonuclease